MELPAALALATGATTRSAAARATTMRCFMSRRLRSAERAGGGGYHAWNVT
jgi:hypothetical protein